VATPGTPLPGWRHQRLDELSWPEIGSDRSTWLVVPVGSTEQHGPHLPFGTDSIVAEALADRLCETRRDSLRAPLIAYGASGEHQGFPGTVSIGTAALSLLLTELLRSARASFAGIVAVSGHGGNAQALATARAIADHEGDRLIVFEPRLEGIDLHAGRAETSLLLALRPGLVRHDEIVSGTTSSLAEISHALRHEGVAAVSPTGILGDPREASAEEGQLLFDAMSSQLLALLEGEVGP